MGFRTRRRQREENLRKFPNESKESFLLRVPPTKKRKRKVKDA